MIHLYIFLPHNFYNVVTQSSGENARLLQSFCPLKPEPILPICRIRKLRRAPESPMPNVFHLLPPPHPTPSNTGPQKSRIGTDLNSTPLIKLTVILQISDLPPYNQQPMNWTEFPSYIIFIFQESGSLRYTSQYRRKGLLPLPRDFNTHGWFLHVIPKNKNHCHFLSQAFLLCWHYVGQK